MITDKRVALQPREFDEREGEEALPEQELHIPAGLRRHQIWRDCPQEYTGYLLLMWNILTEPYDPELSRKACLSRSETRDERRVERMRRNVGKSWHERHPKYIHRSAFGMPDKPWRALFRWKHEKTIGYYPTRQAAMDAWDAAMVRYLQALTKQPGLTPLDAHCIVSVG